MSDGNLLDAWRAGVRQAGERLVERHIAGVYRFFSRKLDDRELVRELTQNTFLAVVESRNDLREGIRFRAFALGVARNILNDHLRRQARRQNRTPKGSATAPAMTPSRVAADHEEQRALLRALRQLPLELQITLEMHYWEELTTAEIGEVLGVAGGTVKWRLSRAREALRATLAELVPAAICTSTLENLEAWAASLRASDDDG